MYFVIGILRKVIFKNTSIKRLILNNIYPESFHAPKCLDLFPEQMYNN